MWLGWDAVACKITYTLLHTFEGACWVLVGSKHQRDTKYSPNLEDTELGSGGVFVAEDHSEMREECLVIRLVRSYPSCYIAVLRKARSRLKCEMLTH